MPYKLELINALSYDGVVKATSKHPFVEVDDLQTAQKVQQTGYFKLLGDHQDDSGELEEDVHFNDDPLSNYTEDELNKMNKGEHEEIITSLDGDPKQAKNPQERVSLILKLQEMLDQLEQQ